jgi:hypothetical protein
MDVRAGNRIATEGRNGDDNMLDNINNNNTSNDSSGPCLTPLY